MSKWFVQYKGSSKGYLAARRKEDGSCEYYKDIPFKKAKDCQTIVNALNAGTIKPIKECETKCE